MEKCWFCGQTATIIHYYGEEKAGACKDCLDSFHYEEPEEE